MPETVQSGYEGLFGSGSDWRERLDTVVAIVRELSKVSDPRELVKVFGARISELLPRDRSITLSRRGIRPPKFLITRFSEWENPADPWSSQRATLPELEGGILGDLIYCDVPRIIDELEVAEDDPAFPYLDGMGSLITMPQYDRGDAMTMTIMMRAETHGFRPEALGEYVWTANLFGRAVQHLRLADELKVANAELDGELKTVSRIQRSLLPSEIPKIPGVDLAAYYHTAHRAGGDYYDFFRIDGNRWGILIADVSGHAADAAVLMAITHAIAHTCPECPDRPQRLLSYINGNLYENYTKRSKAFVTAFYGVYDCDTRRFTYASAGHDSPRIVGASGGAARELATGANLPLGVRGDEAYVEHEYYFDEGDTVVFYTDGIVESRNGKLGQFGHRRLDEVITRGHGSAKALVQSIVAEVEEFSKDHPVEDDRTLLAMRILPR